MRGRRVDMVRALAWLGALATLLVPICAFARPGGGHSFSGSHSSGGGFSGGHSSSGGGNGGAIIYLIALCFEHPTIGIPLLFVVVVFSIVRRRLSSSARGWSSTSGLASQPFQPQPVAYSQGVSRRSLDQIRQNDPEFSTVLFEDFVYVLYAEMQRARSRAGGMSLAAYVSPQVLAQLSREQVDAVQGVVIGAMRVFSINRLPTMWQVVLDFEANLTDVVGQQQVRRYVVDRVTLVRGFQARSRPPARSRTLDCPNCGAPLASLRGDVCSYCHQQVGMGRFDWSVTTVARMKTETRPPLMTSDVAEEGTNLPTVRSPGVDQRLAAISQKDPTFAYNTLLQRVNLIFQEMQAGWSNRDLSRSRPFLSDNLFQSQMYWIDLYTQNRARNVTEKARITHVDLAEVAGDAHFDSITLRIFATGLDYTITDEGKVLSGSRHRERPYSEYWTLIRGAARKGPTHTAPECSNCGAPLKVNMAGSCEYCKVKVTSGDFDWVLSRIEQDDSYTG